MRYAERETDAVVSGIVMMHAVRGMMEEIREAHSVLARCMVDQTRADAPEEAIGAAIAWMRLVVEHE